MNAYPKPYPTRIEKEIIRLLLDLKAETEQEYPRELYEPTRAEYLQQVTTKKASSVAALPTRS